jgi:DNA-binding response OmpR family regulator
MSCVLVVEDEILIRMLVVDLLTDAGFTTLEAKTGDEALPLLEVGGVSLIVTDINMPGRLDGIALAKAARQQIPGIPLVFVSGRPGKLAEARVMDDPAAFVPKPFNFGALIADVKRLLESRSADAIRRGGKPPLCPPGLCLSQ